MNEKRPQPQEVDGHKIVPRCLDLKKILEKKSHFLFGPRQTGKSFWITYSLSTVRLYDLLDHATFLALSRNPERLSQELTVNDRIVVIDEIQRLPDLLNEVHALIERKKIHFLLTGSSARKLRRGGINLLGGRARVQYLHPLTAGELGDQFDLIRDLNRGLLTSIYFSEEPSADLEAYAGVYLQEEIVAEGATRNVPAFSRFLRMAALCNGKIINFTRLASDAQVARTTLYEYFEILKDTLILHEVPAWRKSIKRKPLSASKYYFFDPGVARILQNRRDYSPGTPEFGEAFEAYVFHELISHRDYQGGDPVAYWRSTSGYEVDFILDDHTAIEVKAAENVGPHDLKSLMALAEENIFKRYLCVCLEPRPRKIGPVQIVPLRDFLSALWSANIT